MRFFIFILILCHLTPLYAEDSQSIYFLRAPRSGSHWACYCLNHLLQKNTINSGQTRRERMFKNLIPETNKGNIYVSHNPRDLWLNENSYNQDILILLIRNYRECLIREYRLLSNISNEINFQATFDYLDDNNNIDLIYSYDKNHYFHNLRCFDKWNPNNRILIYYEDLIQNPKEVFREVMTFFKVSDIENKIEQFCKDFESHFQTCLKVYDAQGGSESRGSDLLYHTKKMGYSDSMLIDQLVKNKFSYYFDKYLSRYEINDIGGSSPIDQEEISHAL